MNVGYFNVLTSTAKGDAIISCGDEWVFYGDTRRLGNVDAIRVRTFTWCYYFNVIKHYIIASMHVEMVEFAIYRCYVPDP